MEESKKEAGRASEINKDAIAMIAKELEGIEVAADGEVFTSASDKLVCVCQYLDGALPTSPEHTVVFRGTTRARVQRVLGEHQELVNQLWELAVAGIRTGLDEMTGTTKNTRDFVLTSEQCVAIKAVEWGEIEEYFSEEEISKVRRKAWDSAANAWADAIAELLAAEDRQSAEAALKMASHIELEWGDDPSTQRVAQIAGLDG